MRYKQIELYPVGSSVFYQNYQEHDLLDHGLTSLYVDSSCPVDVSETTAPVALRSRLSTLRIQVKNSSTDITSLARLQTLQQGTTLSDSYPRELSTRSKSTS